MASIKTLTHDPLTVISNFLCWLDVASWRMAGISPNLPKPDIDRIVRERLTRRGIDADRFMAALKKENAYISGSFPLQCIRGVDWEVHTPQPDKVRDTEEKLISEGKRVAGPSWRSSGISRALYVLYQLADIEHDVNTNITSDVFHFGERIREYADRLTAINDQFGLDEFFTLTWRPALFSDYAALLRGRSVEVDKKVSTLRAEIQRDIHQLMWELRRYLDRASVGYSDIDVFVRRDHPETLHAESKYYDKNGMVISTETPLDEKTLVSSTSRLIINDNAVLGDVGVVECKIILPEYRFTNAVGCNGSCIIANSIRVEHDEGFTVMHTGQAHSTVRSKKFALGHNLLNVVVLDSPLKHIGEYFDLPICKVAYTPGRLHIFDLDALIHRRCESDFGRCERVRQYAEEYEDAPSPLSESESGDGGKRSVSITEVNGVFNVLMKRVEKYRSRGFDVTVPESAATYVNATTTTKDLSDLRGEGAKKYTASKRVP